MRIRAANRFARGKRGREGGRGLFAGKICTSTKSDSKFLSSCFRSIAIRGLDYGGEEGGGSAAAVVREEIFYQVIPTAKPSHRRRGETANSRLFYPAIQKRSIARGKR